MKNKALILLIGIWIISLFAINVYANGQDDWLQNTIVSYWQFENTTSQSIYKDYSAAYSNNITLYNYNNVSGIVGNSVILGSKEDGAISGGWELNVNQSTPSNFWQLNSSKNMSFSALVKAPPNVNYGFWIGQYLETNNIYWFMYLENITSIDLRFLQGFTSISENRCLLNYRLNESWIFIAVTYNTMNGGNWSIYANGTLCNRVVSNPTAGATTRRLGGVESNGLKANGTYIDELVWYNVTLNQNNITYIRDQLFLGNHIGNTTTISSTANYSLYMVNKKDNTGAVISGYTNITMVSESTTYFFNSTTGTITTNSSLLMNDTISRWNLTCRAIGYKDKTILNINISSYDNGANCNMSVLFKMNATNNYNESILNFSAILNGSSYISNISGWVQTLLGYDDGLFNLTANTIDHDVFINNSINITNDYTINFTYGYYKLNISAFNYNATSTGQIINLIPISNFTINNLYGNYSTTTGSLILNLTKNANYSIYIDASGYQTDNKTIYMNNYLTITNFTLYTTNSILLNFVNQTGGQVVNVSIELIGSLVNYNYTTNPNSSRYVDLISPGDYQIVYTNPNYPQGYYSFSLTNRSFSNLTLYFISGAFSNITAFVYDELGNTKPNSVIEVYRYSSLSHSYVFEQQAVTNFQGKAILYLQKFNTFYKFNIKYQGVLRLATDPTYILDDVISFNFLALNDIGDDYFTLNGLTSSLTYNNNTGNFRYEFNDLSASSVTSGCLEVTESHNSVTNMYNNTCITGYSGTILIYIAPVNGTTYTAKSFVYIGGVKTFISSLSKSFIALLSSGNAGLFYTILVTIVFAFIGLYSPVLAVLLTPLPFLISSMAGIVAINPAIMIFMELIAIIIAFILGRFR